MLLLVIFEILGLLVNILTADNKCSLRSSQNLQQPIQMQLCHKHQTFSNVFAPILKPTSNPGQFEKKDDPPSLCIYKIRNSKRSG